MPKALDQRVHTAVGAQQAPLGPRVNGHRHKVQVFRRAEAKEVALQYAQKREDNKQYDGPAYQEPSGPALIIEEHGRNHAWSYICACGMRAYIESPIASCCRPTDHYKASGMMKKK